MALLPDVDSMPFLNPYYDTLTEALDYGDEDEDEDDEDDDDEYTEYGGGSGDGMVSVLGGSGDYLDYNSIISAGEEQISAGEGGGSGDYMPRENITAGEGGRRRGQGGQGRRPVKEADPMDGWFPGQEAAQRNR